MKFRWHIDPRKAITKGIEPFGDLTVDLPLSRINSAAREILATFELQVVGGNQIMEIPRLKAGIGQIQDEIDSLFDGSQPLSAEHLEKICSLYQSLPTKIADLMSKHGGMIRTELLESISEEVDRQAAVLQSAKWANLPERLQGTAFVPGDWLHDYGSDALPTWVLEQIKRLAPEVVEELRDMLIAHLRERGIRILRHTVSNQSKSLFVHRFRQGKGLPVAAIFPLRPDGPRIGKLFERLGRLKSETLSEALAQFSSINGAWAGPLNWSTNVLGKDVRQEILDTEQAAQVRAKLSELSEPFAELVVRATTEEREYVTQFLEAMVREPGFEDLAMRNRQVMIRAVLQDSDPFNRSALVDRFERGEIPADEMAHLLGDVFLNGLPDTASDVDLSNAVPVKEALPPPVAAQVGKIPTHQPATVEIFQQGDNKYARVTGRFAGVAFSRQFLVPELSTTLPQSVTAQA